MIHDLLHCLGDPDEDFESDSMDEEEIDSMLDADFEKRRTEERAEDKFLVREKIVLIGEW